MHQTTYWFSDEEYSRILDNLVIVCVDTLLYHKTKGLFLGKRNRFPLHDWWIFGGRMRAHETHVEAAQRGLFRELGIIPEKPFELIGYFDLVWDIREEAIQKNGCHVLLVAMKCKLSDNEATNIKISGNDHEQSKWFNYDELEVSSFSPYLSQIIKQSGITKSLS